MLYRNEPEKGLQPHQLAAYRAVKRGFREKRKASVIMPTGCGKSFVALQAMLDYKDDNILITVPTIVIKNQYYEYIAKYIAGEEPTAERTARMIAEEYFPNLKIITYAAIERADPEILKKLNPKLAITDEAHKADAEQTSKKMEVLFDSFPDAYWLGITATPERMDGKNVVDHFYEGTKDYELTLEEALRRRIVKEPHYVPCAYALSDKLVDVKKAIDECTNPQKRAKLEELYEKMRNIVANAEGIPELITNSIQVKDGKVIVFCKDKEHMDELMSKVSEWFGQIDSDPEVYSLYSGSGYTTQENIETIKAFKASKSNHLKILYTIDMLNEGIHMDVDTIIMARPTESKLVYSQQMGRGLSSDPNAKATTMIDLVNNYLNFDLDRTINQLRGTSSTGKEDDDRVDDGDFEAIDDEYIPIDCFKITGVIRDFLDLLEEVNQISSGNRYVRFAEEIYSWVMDHKKFPSSSSLCSQEEQELVAKYYRLKYRYIDKYLCLESDDEKEQFKIDNPRIDDVIQMMEEVRKYDIPAQLRNAYNIYEWMSTMKYPVTPKPSATDPVEKSLGVALNNLKKFVKNYRQISDKEERTLFENRHPEIHEVIELLDIIKEEDTPEVIFTALEIREWVESQKEPRKPSYNNPDELAMARQLTGIKSKYITTGLNECTTEIEEQEYRKKYPFIDRLKKIIDDIDEMCRKKPIALQNAEEIKAWIIEHKTDKRPSTTSEDPREVQLAEAYSTIVRKRIKKYESITNEEEKREYEESHPEIFEIIEIIEWIDNHTISDGLINARRIRDWMEMPEHQRFPKRQFTRDSKFKEGYYESEEMQTEHAMRVSLNSLRSGILKNFLSLTPEKRAAHIKKHKNIVEVLAIINDLDLRFGSKKQRELAELIHQDRDLHERLEAALALEKEYQARAKKENEQQKSEQGVDIDGE